MDVSADARDQQSRRTKKFQVLDRKVFMESSSHQHCSYMLNGISQNVCTKW